jgi:hypothetical protein
MRPIRISLIVLVMVLAAQTVHAEGTTLPPLAPLTSVRWNFVTSFNGKPLSFCQEEYETASRGHAVCYQLVTVALPEYGMSLVAGQKDEIILYDKMIYQRKNAETTWAASPNPFYSPTATLRDLYTFGHAAALTQIGQVDVDGTSTTQFQYWSLDSAYNQRVGGQAVYDLFLTADGHVRKAQLSYRGTLSLGQGELQGIYVYRDFNTPITVTPPLAATIRTP